MSSVINYLVITHCISVQVVTVLSKHQYPYRYLDWNSHHPVSAKMSVISSLTSRAKAVCSSPEALANEMDHLHRVLAKNHYPQWSLNERKSTSPPEQQKYKKGCLISVPYVKGFSEPFRRALGKHGVKVIFTGANTLKSLLVHPKDMLPNGLKQDVVYHWKCSAPGCTAQYIGETNRSLQVRVQKHANKESTAIKQQCDKEQHPKASLSDLKIIDKESRNV